MSHPIFPGSALAEALFGSETEPHTGPVYVLVALYGDMSGVQHVWGPYLTEESAEKSWQELTEIGVAGAHEVVPLRQSVPTTTTTLRVRKRAEATS